MGRDPRSPNPLVMFILLPDGGPGTWCLWPVEAAFGSEPTDVSYTASLVFQRGVKTSIE
jgi:hypothetical protein